jgi:hypothetical protein
MNLDEHSSFSRLDNQNVLAEIDSCRTGCIAPGSWLSPALPRWEGSASFDRRDGRLPPAVTCWPPIWNIPARRRSLSTAIMAAGLARGSQTLVITVSHSGTRKRQSQPSSARAGGCRCLAITTGAGSQPPPPDPAFPPGARAPARPRPQWKLPSGCCWPSSPAGAGGRSSAELSGAIAALREQAKLSRDPGCPQPGQTHAQASYLAVGSR